MGNTISTPQPLHQEQQLDEGNRQQQYDGVQQSSSGSTSSSPAAHPPTLTSSVASTISSPEQPHPPSTHPNYTPQSSSSLVARHVATSRSRRRRLFNLSPFLPYWMGRSLGGTGQFDDLAPPPTEDPAAEQREERVARRLGGLGRRFRWRGTDESSSDVVGMEDVEVNEGTEFEARNSDVETADLNRDVEQSFSAQPFSADAPSSPPPLARIPRMTVIAMRPTPSGPTLEDAQNPNDPAPDNTPENENTARLQAHLQGAQAPHRPDQSALLSNMLARMGSLLAQTAPSTPTPSTSTSSETTPNDTPLAQTPLFHNSRPTLTSGRLFMVGVPATGFPQATPTQLPSMPGFFPRVDSASPPNIPSTPGSATTALPGHQRLRVFIIRSPVNTNEPGRRSATVLILSEPGGAPGLNGLLGVRRQAAPAGGDEAPVPATDDATGEARAGTETSGETLGQNQGNPAVRAIVSTILAALRRGSQPEGTAAANQAGATEDGEDRTDATEDVTTEDANATPETPGLATNSDGERAQPEDPSIDPFGGALISILSQVMFGAAPTGVTSTIRPMPFLGNGLSYEALLRLAELIGPARPRHASREDVDAQLPIVLWKHVDAHGGADVEGEKVGEVFAEEVIRIPGGETIDMMDLDSNVAATAESQTSPPTLAPAAMDVDSNVATTAESHTSPPTLAPDSDSGDSMPTESDFSNLAEDVEQVPLVSPWGVKDLLACTREKCTICLTQYEEEDPLRILRCKHGYHKDCIDQWLCGHVNSCPLCRAPGTRAVQAAPAAAAAGGQTNVEV
ncbi:hypothetical protein HDV05_003657 [Chytridiales sp. JEL 0842]|nr:hypothetical protein HDV05_003657 [Chytridiales sp. JEL 0842]